MKPVTDPRILAQLNDTVDNNQATLDIFTPDDVRPQLKKVTDPDILAQLNTPDTGVPAAKQMEQPVEGTSIPRTVFDQGMQGATFGFADEVMNPLGALAASLFTDPISTLKGEVNNPDLAESLIDVNNTSKQRLNAQMRENPVTSIASQVAGNLLTGAAGATTKAGAAVANSLRTGGVGAGALKGALAGAASGGLYGAGTADEGNRLEGAESGAAIGGAFGAAAPVIGAAVSSTAKGVKNAAKGAVARSPEALQDALAAMQDKVSQSYQQMRAIGANVGQTSAMKLASDIKKELATQEFIPSLNPKTLGIINDLDEQIASVGGGGISLNRLDQYRRQLGRIGASEDGVSAGGVRRVIDDFIDKIKPTDLTKGTPDAMRLLKEGRKQAQQAFKFEAVSDVIKNAENNPDRLKAGLNKLSETMKGLTIPEKMALKQAAQSGGGDKLARALGTFGFDAGKLKNIALPTLVKTGALAIPGGTPLVAAGTVARQGRKLAARGNAENLLQAIEQAFNGNVSPVASQQSRIPQYINPSLMLGQAANAASPLMRIP